MTVKELCLCIGLWVLGATVELPFTTTIFQKKKIVGRIPRRGFYLLILVCLQFFFEYTNHFLYHSFKIAYKTGNGLVIIVVLQ